MIATGSSDEDVISDECIQSKFMVLQVLDLNFHNMFPSGPNFCIPHHQSETSESLLLHRDEFEFAKNILGKPGNFDTASGGLVGRVELFVDGIELGKVTHVLEEDGSLENVADVSVGSIHDGLDVLEHLLSLGFDSTFDDLHGFWDKRDRARSIDQSIVLDSLAVRTDGLGSLVGSDNGIRSGRHGANLGSRQA